MADRPAEVARSQPHRVIKPVQKFVAGARSQGGIGETFAMSVADAAKTGARTRKQVKQFVAGAASRQGDDSTFAKLTAAAKKLNNNNNNNKTKKHSNNKKKATGKAKEKAAAKQPAAAAARTAEAVPRKGKTKAPAPKASAASAAAALKADKARKLARRLLREAGAFSPAQSGSGTSKKSKRSRGSTASKQKASGKGKAAAFKGRGGGKAGGKGGGRKEGGAAKPASSKRGRLSLSSASASASLSPFTAAVLQSSSSSSLASAAALLKVGDRVEAKPAGSNDWIPGTLVTVNKKGELFKVAFDDGVVEKNVFRDHILWLDEPNVKEVKEIRKSGIVKGDDGPEAFAASDKPWLLLAEGSVIAFHGGPSRWHTGEVQRRVPKKGWKVKWDADGTTATVPLEQKSYNARWRMLQRPPAPAPARNATGKRKAAAAKRGGGAGRGGSGGGAGRGGSGGGAAKKTKLIAAAKKALAPGRRTSVQLDSDSADGDDDDDDAASDDAEEIEEQEEDDDDDDGGDLDAVMRRTGVYRDESGPKGAPKSAKPWTDLAAGCEIAFHWAPGEWYTAKVLYRMRSKWGWRVKWHFDSTTNDVQLEQKTYQERWRLLAKAPPKRKSKAAARSDGSDGDSDAGSRSGDDSDGGGGSDDDDNNNDGDDADNDKFEGAEDGDDDDDGDGDGDDDDDEDDGSGHFDGVDPLSPDDSDGDDNEMNNEAVWAYHSSLARARDSQRFRSTGHRGSGGGGGGGGVARRAPRAPCAKPDKRSELSSYELARQTRISDNEAHLRSLLGGGGRGGRGGSGTIDMQSKGRRAGHATPPLRTKLPRFARSSSASSKTRKQPQRQSLRVRGKGPDGEAVPNKAASAAPERRAATRQLGFQAEHDEDDKVDFEQLLQKWRAAQSSSEEDRHCSGRSTRGRGPATSKSKSKPKASPAAATAGGAPQQKQQQRLFLIPSGPPGVNDHTLYEKVPEVGDHFLWGFCSGLYSRIFAHVRPGDIFCFTAAGTGAFHLVASVKETRVVPHDVSDKIWKRMSYHMGGPAKSNIAFPLLVLLEQKPVDVAWRKEEVMRLCGYSDRLQTSRRIHLDDNPGGRAVLERCNATIAAAKAGGKR